MAERYETGTSERRRSATSGKQSPRPTSQRATSDQRTRTIDREELRRRSRYSSDEEYERARRRRIAERRRRKKREKRINIICAVIAIVALSAAICSGVFFFSQKNEFNAVSEEAGNVALTARDKERAYENIQNELESMEKEIASLQSELTQE